MSDNSSEEDVPEGKLFYGQQEQDKEAMSRARDEEREKMDYEPNVGNRRKAMGDNTSEKDRPQGKLYQEQPKQDKDVTSNALPKNDFESSKIPKIIECDENMNLELLNEMYLLVHGGGSVTRLYSLKSRLTQIMTPVENTLLHMAAWYGNNEVVDFVAEHVPELLFKENSNKDTALHVAARAGRVSTIGKLLAAYTNFQHSGIAKEWIIYSDLHIPPKDYNAEQNMKGLLTLLQAQNVQDNTMLHEAVLSGDSKSKVVVKIFQILEQYSTEDNKGDSLSNRCYEFALKITNKAKQSVLYLAVEGGDKEAVNLILTKSPEELLPEGLSPLLPPIMKRDDDMLNIILSIKPDWIHLIDEHERLALHYAAYIGYHEGVINLLEKCKCCSLRKDKYGYFPLHLASHKGYVKVVRELLGYCLDPTEMLDKYGRNILHIAAKNGNHEVVLYILKTDEHEKLINQKDKDGNTPLHLAASYCHPKVVYYLTLDNKVELGVVNQKNQTPLDIVHAIYQQQNPSLRQQLSWIALKSADVKPTSSEVLIPVPSGGKLNEISSKKEPNKAKPLSTEVYKDRVETLILVSTLIITASVAACLQIPGEADGAAHNLNHAMFQFFIFFITISFFSSVSATIILFWTQLGYIELLSYALKIVMPLLGVALISLSLAFMAGLYTVISNLSWLATFFVIMAVIFIIVVALLYILLFLPSPSTNKLWRRFSYHPFIFLASLAEPKIDQS